MRALRTPTDRVRQRHEDEFYPLPSRRSGPSRWVFGRSSVDQPASGPGAAAALEADAVEAGEVPGADALPPAEVCRRMWADDPYGRVMLELDGTVRWLNESAAALLGYSVQATVGRSMADFIAPDDVAVAIEALTEIEEELSVADEGVPMVLGLLCHDGSTVQAEIGAQSFLDVPEIAGICLRVRPYDSQRYLERFLTGMAAGAPLQVNLGLLVRSLDNCLQQSVSAIVHGWNGDGFTGVVSAGLDGVLPALVGEQSADLDQSPWMRCRRTAEVEWSAVEDLPELVRAIATEHGLRACWAQPIVVPPDGVLAVIIVWRSLPSSPRVGHRHVLERSAQAAALAFEKRRSEELLVRAATVDPLTGIPNRSQFFASLESSMDTSEPGRLGVLYLDLDGFKPVNDTHGHRVGDRLLATIGARLGANVRPGDLVARLGGDEFAVLCTEICGEVELCEVADRLIAVVSQPVVLDGIEITIGVSIGVAVAQVHGETQDEVLDSADAALYRAKRAGRGRYRMALRS